VTNDLFLAILSMDAYNRTGAQQTPVGLVLPDGTMLGNASVLSGDGGVLEDRSSGFFAQAYQLQNGTKIISYRGTDTTTGSEFAKDALYGWVTGGGAYTNAQAELAAKFFQWMNWGQSNISYLALAR